MRSRQCIVDCLLILCRSRTSSLSKAICNLSGHCMALVTRERVLESVYIRDVSDSFTTSVLFPIW